MFFSLYSFTQSILEILLIVLMTLLSLEGLGYLLARGIKFNRKCTSLSFSITHLIMGLFFISTVNYFVGLTGFEVKTIIVFEYFVGFVTGIALRIINRKQSIKKALMNTLPYLILPLWQYTPAIWRMSHSGGGIGMAATGNNDIANYTLVTANFFKNGFKFAGNVNLYDLGKFAKVSNYQTPQALQSFICAGLHIPVWNTALPTIILASIISGLAAMHLIESFFDKVKFEIAILAINICFAGALMNYILVNFFLGQVIATAVSLFVLSEAIRLGKKGRSTWKDIIPSIFGIGVSIYAYPPFLIPFILVYVGVFVLVQIFVFKKISWHNTFFTSLGIVSAFVVASPYLVSAIKLLIAQGSVLAGWPIPTMNPLAVFVFPKLMGQMFSAPLNFISWVLLLFLATSQLFRIKFKDGPTTNFFKYLFVVAILGYLVAVTLLGGGFSRYQNWKLLAYVIPLTVPVLIYCLAVNGRFSKLTLYFLLFLVATSPLVEWNRGLPYKNYVTGDMVKTSQQINNLKITHLNIDLRPYFESMTFVSMLPEVKLFLNQPTYLTSSISADSCTLISVDNKQHHSNLVVLNQSYALAKDLHSVC